MNRKEMSFEDLKEKLKVKDNKDIDKMFEALKDQVKPNEKDLETLKEMADKYSKKSEEDIFAEIMKLNQKMMNSENSEEFKKRLKKLEQLRPILNEEQQKKLDKLLKTLIKDS